MCQNLAKSSKNPFSTVHGSAIATGVDCSRQTLAAAKHSGNSTSVGTRTNGKGEEIQVNAPGISVKQLLEQYSVSADQGLTVIADDGYSATLKAEEISSGQAFLILEDDTVRLVVFGDSNSKRSVSNVKQLMVLQ